MSNNDKSRIPKFYKYSVENRLDVLREKEILNQEDYVALREQMHLLSQDDADKMIENVIGVFGLPMGLGLNFLINEKPYVVPMVVEEPSILAAVSSAAKVVRNAGGFESESDDPILIGQIQLVDVRHPMKVRHAILQEKQEILNLANSLHPNMVKRGGGAIDLEVMIHQQDRHPGSMVVVHLLVDTRDAMGANLVNSMCEGVAPLIEKTSGSKVYLRILSNLTDRAMVRSKCVIPTQYLDFNDSSGKEVRDGIIRAAEFAAIDPYRASTHNKGIMNGIDPLAIATGNDWRAIEAAAHAYAARSGRYTSLTNWYKNENGDLVGTIDIPLKVGTVGGSLKSNRAVGIAHRILGIESATELAEVMGAVGLAQNFSALRSLGTEGIQRGHMTLHARSVASTAGAPAELFEKVLERLVESGEIKVWKAKEIIEELKGEQKVGATGKISLPDDDSEMSFGYGKIILTGEHSVVHGTHAVAAPITLKMKAKVWDHDKGVRLLIPRWGVEQTIEFGADHKYSIYKSLEMMLDHLDLRNRPMNIEVFPEVPRAMGMGGSAALAVAIIRALDKHFELGLGDDDVRRLSFESENIVHGGASGIDNTVSTYGNLIMFQKGTPPKMETLSLNEPIPIVIGLSGVESMTSKMVKQVREQAQKYPQWYEKIFKQMDELALASKLAIEKRDLNELGMIMNMNHGYLNTLGVSYPEVEDLIEIARNSGALGAKLTGGGGGGAMIALCDSDKMQKKIQKKMHEAGYDALIAEIKPSTP
ncbi:hydroxymethylglutaryl-CoA reductase, degradative [Rhodohalobacter halophilus]|uniref:hydroxymethylglutaryl-CoA reductase, degradative n=1 Tax=Rhodohalobacter halophilus TaxID=1812810 RepID=UPI00083FB4EB|nr:hydroxymethylglutaryl-CoA reductase, degradative [Rhodohalobacter halophilus]